MNWGRICILAITTLGLHAQTELRVAVGVTPAQNIFNRIVGPFEKATGIKLILKDARSPEAWCQLDAGEADAASGGLTWEDWLKSIKAKNLRVPSDEEVTRFQIGTDKIQVLTSLDILLLELDREELRDIFSGKITNWKTLGAGDKPLTVLLDPTQIATNDTFRGQILEGQPFAPAPWTFPAGTTLLQAVAQTPHAIGFAPKAAQESLQVNSPMTPDITRPILLLIKGKKPSEPVKKLLAYLESKEGKKLTVH
jgi:phosphate transport system substrate-binding protein